MPPYDLARDVSADVRAPFVSTPLPDAEPTTFRWTQSPEGAASFVALDLDIVRGDDAASRHVRFFFPPEYLAGGLPQVALPPLPEALAEFTPVVGDALTPVISMTRVNDGVAYPDIAGVYDLYVRGAAGDPSRLLETAATTGITFATTSKSP